MNEINGAAWALKWKRMLLTLCVLLAAGLQPLAAQDAPVVLQGRVVDANSKEAVPYAILSVMGTTVGCQTNMDGYYRLQVQETPKARVVVSCIGYRSDTLSLKDLRKKKELQLKPQPYELNQVTVSEYTKPSSVLKEVLRRIPDNYYCDTMVGNYFMRTYSLLDDRLWLFCEGILDVLRVGYDKQYPVKLGGMVRVDLKGQLDSLMHAGNDKVIRRSRLLVFDTNMLRNALGDSVYAINPLLGRGQTLYEGRGMQDPLQNTEGNVFLKSKRMSRLDKKAKLYFLDDAQGESYYLITRVAGNDSSSILINKRDMAVCHMYTTTLHADTILLPVMFRRVVRGFVIHYRSGMVRYEKRGDRYMLSLSEHKSSMQILPSERRVIVPELNKGNVREDYMLWALQDLQPGTAAFLDTNHIVDLQPHPYSEVFEPGSMGDAYWQNFNFIPIEKRITRKLQRRFQNSVAATQTTPQAVREKGDE